jgi:hypothetical protein
MISLSEKIYKSIRERGIVGTIKKTFRLINTRYSPIIRDLASYVLCKLLGPRLAYSLVLAVFKFKCRYNLFLGNDRCLWLGKSLTDYVTETIYISPLEIKYQIKGGYVPYIQSGNWDLKKKEFELNTTIKEIFINEVPIMETNQYKEMLKKIKSGKKAYWCKSEADLEKYFKILLKACNDIRKNIYLSHEELEESTKQKWRARYQNEVLISIDRNGNYIHESGGSHRLSMAKIYNIDKIPAAVIRKHYLCIKSQEKKS